jgi:hypothetical protein
MKGLIVLTAALIAPLRVLPAAVLDADALRAWMDYVNTADLRMKPRLQGQLPFLWTDESADRRRRVAAGDTVIAPATDNGFRNAPNALIHHWIGAVFIPHATLQQLAATLHSYGRYKDFYRPFVVDSKVCPNAAADQEFTLVLQYRTMFGSFAYETRYTVREYLVDERRRYSISDTPLVREIVAYGAAGERALPSGTGTGFVWRLHTIARYEQRDGGVYLELEALALTRGIPGPLRWMVTPMVKRMSINSMEAALIKTRNAARAVNTVTEVMAAHPGTM